MDVDEHFFFIIGSGGRAAVCFRPSPLKDHTPDRSSSAPEISKFVRSAEHFDFTKYLGSFREVQFEAKT